MSGAPGLTPDFAPEYGRGYLRVPLATWLAVFCQAPLTRRQLQLVAVVIRESWGWQRRGGGPYLWTRPLPSARFAEATGLSTDRIGRDLRALVARNVLRERGGCYQLVPDPAAWLPPAAGEAPRRRPAAPNPSPPSAASALGTGSPKIADRQQTNVAAQRNVAANQAEDGGGSADAAAELHALARERAERFVRIVVGFVGALPAGREAELRRWVARAGVAACWARLEPGFRGGPATAAGFLAGALAEERARRQHPPGTGGEAPPPA